MLTSPNRVVALILGAVLDRLRRPRIHRDDRCRALLDPGGLLVGLFEVNPAQNILHIAIGVVLFITGLIGAFWAQIANILVGLFLLALGLAGLFLIGSTLNIVAINVADNVVHFAAAAVLLAVGLGAGKPVFPKRKAADA